MAFKFSGADFEGFERPVHGNFGKRTGLADALAESNDPRKRIDHAETAPGRARKQKAAVIGAKVDCSKNAVLGPAVLKAAVLNAPLWIAGERSGWGKVSWGKVSMGKVSLAVAALLCHRCVTLLFQRRGPSLAPRNPS
mgnify:CR=1 FL=1